MFRAIRLRRGFLAAVAAAILIPAILLSFNAFFGPSTDALSIINYTVIVDAGHGGFDGGAIGPDGVLEKDINLAIALELERTLLKNGFTVIMTRTDDTAVRSGDAATIRQNKNGDLNARIAIAEEHPDAIFVSIHMNTYQTAGIRGTQVFYGGGNSEGSILANTIQKSVKEGLQPDNKRTTKAADGVRILEKIENPAVIIECGFLTNPEEGGLLQTESYQREFAQCVCDGIYNYYYSKPTG